MRLSFVGRRERAVRSGSVPPTRTNTSFSSFPWTFGRTYVCTPVAQVQPPALLRAQRVLLTRGEERLPPSAPALDRPLRPSERQGWSGMNCVCVMYLAPQEREERGDCRHVPVVCLLQALGVLASVRCGACVFVCVDNCRRPVAHACSVRMCSSSSSSSSRVRSCCLPPLVHPVDALYCNSPGACALALCAAYELCWCPRRSHGVNSVSSLSFFWVKLRPKFHGFVCVCVYVCMT